MKKTAFACIAAFLLFPARISCGEFKDSGSVFSVDFPPGWKEGKSNDASVTLRLEKGRSFFEFVRLDSELGDYYLKARVKEQVDALRGKGTTLEGDVKSISLHGVSSAYYTSYESMGVPAHMAFFTYNGMSYAISASGINEGDFRTVVSTLRKPGEKIEIPKQKKIKMEKREKDADEDSGVQIFREDEPAAYLPEATGTAKSGKDADEGFGAGIFKEDEPAILDEGDSGSGPAEFSLAQKTGFFLSAFAAKMERAGRAPYLVRKPLNILVWAVVILLWFAGSFIARAEVRAYKNPKLPPPPAEVPPDFFFPFLISRSTTLKEAAYNITTRQKQQLLAVFSFEYEVYFAAAVYGALLFNVFWSLLALAGRSGLITDILLPLPAGRLLASFPEMPFLALFLTGVISYFTKRRVLRLYDAQSNLLLEVAREVSYGLIRDGHGKEAARLVYKTGVAGRRWEYVDTDNMVVFSIRDDCPRIHFMRTLFGHLGGALRSRYGIFVQERRAGFVFLEPGSGDRFQVHMDFDFARLAPPAQILASLLYIISRERDPAYPSPF